MSVDNSPVAWETREASCFLCGADDITGDHACPVPAGIRDWNPVAKIVGPALVAGTRVLALRPLRIEHGDFSLAVPVGHEASGVGPEHVVRAAPLPCGHMFGESALIDLVQPGQQLWAVYDNNRYAVVAEIKMDAELRCVGCGMQFDMESQWHAHTGVGGVLRRIEWSPQVRLTYPYFRSMPLHGRPCCESWRTLGCYHSPKRATMGWVIVDSTCARLLAQAGVEVAAHARLIAGLSLANAYRYIETNRTNAGKRLGISAVGPLLRKLAPINEARPVARWSGGDGKTVDIRYVSTIARHGEPGGEFQTPVRVLQFVIGLLLAGGGECCCGCTSKTCHTPLLNIASKVGVPIAMRQNGI